MCGLHDDDSRPGTLNAHQCVYMGAEYVAKDEADQAEQPTAAAAAAAEMFECVVCMEAFETLSILCPCGHRCVCSSCSGAYSPDSCKKKQPRCPLCDTEVLLVLSQVFDV